MSKDFDQPPQTRSWRDIPQQVKPRAMTPGGRRRVVFSSLRTVTAVGVVAGVLAVAYFAAQALQEQPQSVAKTADTVPVKEIALTTDGVLDQNWIKSTLALPRTASLMELDLLKLRDRLLASGQVQTATVTRRFPATLAVAVSERSPVARVMAQLGSAEPQQFLVARDGVVYAGTGYDQTMIDSLVWLDGVKLVRDGARFQPVAGMEAAADLLAKARNEAPHLYSTWKVISLARLESDREIIVRAANIERIVFSTSDDYFRQLARLDVLSDLVPGSTARPMREVNLAVGRTADGRAEVPVTLDVAQPAATATKAVGLPTRPPAAAAPTNPFLNPQKKPSREL